MAHVMDYEDLLDKKGDNIIDSRDLIAALESYDDAINDDEGLFTVEEQQAIVEEYGELAEEVRALDGCCEDWTYGATLINEDYFEDYAREVAQDIGALDSDSSWPHAYIDWPAAARALQMDYTTVEYGGDTYYVR